MATHPRVGRTEQNRVREIRVEGGRAVALTIHGRGVRGNGADHTILLSTPNDGNVRCIWYLDSQMLRICFLALYIISTAGSRHTKLSWTEWYQAFLVSSLSYHCGIMLNCSVPQ